MPVAVAGADQPHVGYHGANRRHRLQEVEHAFARLEPAEEQHQVGAACVVGAQRGHRVRHASDARLARDAARPRAQRFRGHHHTGGTLEEKPHQRAPPAGSVVVEALEAAAMQLQDHRIARGERRRHEHTAAPEARARRRVQMQRDAPLLEQRSGERAQRLGGDFQLLERRAVAMRGEVIDRPALEKPAGAVRVDHRGNAAARFGRGAEHQESGIQWGFDGHRPIMASGRDGAVTAP